MPAASWGMDCFVSGTFNNFDKMGMNYVYSHGKFAGEHCYHRLSGGDFQTSQYGYSVTCGTPGLSFIVQDVTTRYPVSGIDSYTNPGMTVDGVLYGNNRALSFSTPHTAILTLRKDKCLKVR